MVGLRISVQDVLEYLASGMSTAQILADFPDLEADDIRAALAFAADRERRFVSAPAKEAPALRLIIDHNLSPRLATALRDVFDEVVHVRDVGLSRGTDREVWTYAADHRLGHPVEGLGGCLPQFVRQLGLG